jgi:hypothetical protein
MATLIVVSLRFIYIALVLMNLILYNNFVKKYYPTLEKKHEYRISESANDIVLIVA